MASRQISYEEAARAVEAAVKAARELGFADQVTIAVTDASGYLVAMRRGDDRWFHAEIAVARAYSAAALRRDGRLTGSLLGSRAHWRTMPDFMAGRISLGPGGVLLRDDGSTDYHHGLGEKISGAIGVSGAPDPDVDEEIARAGARAVRLDLVDDGNI
ncbi:MAG TPA: heme-binding protein [Trebonia sp.]|jgi:uncharacterized protein GlcG (DUF336 family)|nr:heme-binding protein [Trebonia sp.]